MKELFSKNFWTDVKHTFDDAREGQEAAAPLAPPRGLLFDMDGVLYDGDRTIAGAAETIGWVQAQAIPHLFVTNTTSRSRAVLVEKLAKYGITSSETEILTPIAAVSAWLRANAQGDIAAFVRPSARTEFGDLPLLSDDAEQGAAYVVIGDLGPHWDFATLNRAFRLLYNNPGAKLIALGMTRYWMSPEGIALDVAPFVVALEHASRRRALVFGKPSPVFFRAAAERLGLPPAEILMVGDDIEADVLGAQSAGFQGALVRTGKFRQMDVDRAPRKPDFILDSIADLPAQWDTLSGRGSTPPSLPAPDSPSSSTE